MVNPICSEVTLSMLCSDVMLPLGDQTFASDMQVFEYLGFGLILSMDWLSLYDAHIYYTDRIVP